MAIVAIDSGPIAAEDFLPDVPQERWRELMLARQRFCAVKLSHDCRCLIQFINDAKIMFRTLGFANPEEMIREGYKLEPNEIAVAVRWLELNPPSEPIPLDIAIRLGKHGGDRKSEKAKDQGSNPILKGRGRDYDLARLDRDRPDLAERVRAGEMSANAAAVEAGFRRKLTPFQQIVRLLPKLSADEREKLKAMLS